MLIYICLPFVQLSVLQNPEETISLSLKSCKPYAANLFIQLERLNEPEIFNY